MINSGNKNARKTPPASQISTSNLSPKWFFKPYVVIFFTIVLFVGIAVLIQYATHNSTLYPPKVIKFKIIGKI